MHASLADKTPCASASVPYGVGVQLHCKPLLDIDDFPQLSFEEAKRFLEKASDEEGTEGINVYLHAALNLGFSALEAHVNAIADDFPVRSELSVLEKSILLEQE